MWSIRDASDKPGGVHYDWHDSELDSMTSCFRNRAFALLAACCLSLHAGAQEQGRAPGFTPEEWRVIETLAPDPLPPPPVDATNKYADDPQAAALGKKLFFDPRFSGRLLEGDNDGGPHSLGRKGEAGRVSCAGCHVPHSGFVDSRSLGGAISLAAGWGRRRAPSLLDVGQARLLMWDGRRDTLHSQVFEAIESPLEMNSSRLFVAQQLARHYKSEYEVVFGALPRFDDPAQYPQIQPEQAGCVPKGVAPTPRCNGQMHGMPGDGAEFDQLPPPQQEAVTRAIVNMGKALGSYQRRLTCGPSRFDEWVAGRRDAMSAGEQRGLKLFIGKGGCVNCHSGPYFSDQKFHNVGLIPQTVAVAFQDSLDEDAYKGIGVAINDPLNSRGQFSDADDRRLPQALGDELRGAYRTPMLRCVGLRPSFMRTGQIKTLQEVIEFFNKGGAAVRLNGENVLKPLGLDAEEKDDLLKFLLALAGPGPAEELLAP